MRHHLLFLIFVLLCAAGPARRAEALQHPQQLQETDVMQLLERKLNENLGNRPASLKASPALIRSAKDGDLVSQYTMGRVSALGGNDAAAAEWYRLSAKQGFGFAAEQLGRLYHQGRGVEQNDAEAAKWFLAAADHKAITSLLQYRLALIHHFGIGVAQDEAAAEKWYGLALQQGLLDASVAKELLAAKGPAGDVFARFAEKYNSAEMKGSAKDMNNLGFLHLFGIGVREDEKEAIRLFEKAAEAGDAPARYNAGRMAKWRGDTAAMARWIRMAAEQGHALAQWELGVILTDGAGLPQDQAAAVDWTRKAAEAGVVGAQNNLGWHYQEGKGVPASYPDALKWYGKAADAGYYAAFRNLGYLYDQGFGVTQDKKKAAELYLKAAEWGDDVSQNNLGLLYHYSAKEAGLIPDRTLALKWFRRAAEQMNADSQTFTGSYYENGWGTQQDFAEAAKWYRQAAQQGHSMAQFDLGLLLDTGAEGVPQNRAEACAWFLRAGLQNNIEAQYNTGQCFHEGRNGPADAAQAAKWMCLAAERGYADAQFNMGAMYHVGDGVEKDDAESYFWFVLAARSGNEGAPAAVQEVGQALNALQRKAAEDKADHWTPVKGLEGTGAKGWE